MSLLGSWIKRSACVRRINEYILQRPEILVTKAVDYSGCGLHWYNFSLEDRTLGRKVKGTGAAFDDAMAIQKGWGEFVERYSFAKTILGQNGTFTSNAFAAHSSYKQACLSSLAELIERDIFLTNWLLRAPASRIHLDDVRLSWKSRLHLKELKNNGVLLDFGVCGACLGFIVGIVCVMFSDRFCVLTTAKQTMEQLVEQLTQEAAVALSSWNAPDRLYPVNVLPADVRPIDHHRYYLSRGNEALPMLITTSRCQYTYPDFNFHTKDLTNDNSHAVGTGYYTCYTESTRCQQLWFGETSAEVINLERLKSVVGRNVSLSELNYAPHPIA